MSKKRQTILGAIFAVSIFAGSSWFMQVRAKALDEKCIDNLRCIAGAKQQWAVEKFASKSRPLGRDYFAQDNAIPTENDVHSYNSRNQYPMQHCPRGGKYTIGRVADAPACSYPGHFLIFDGSDSMPDFFRSVLIDIHASDATELIIGIEHGEETPLKCKVGEMWRQTRFSSELRPQVIAELQRWAEMPASKFPSEGTFVVPFGKSSRYEWRVRMESADAECVLTPIRE